MVTVSDLMREFHARCPNAGLTLEEQESLFCLLAKTKAAGASEVGERLETVLMRREGLLHEVLICGGEDCLGPKLVERIKAEVGPVAGGEG